MIIVFFAYNKKEIKMKENYNPSFSYKKEEIKIPGSFLFSFIKQPSFIELYSTHNNPKKKVIITAHGGIGHNDSAKIKIPSGMELFPYVEEGNILRGDYSISTTVEFCLPVESLSTGENIRDYKLSHYQGDNVNEILKRFETCSTLQNNYIGDFKKKASKNPMELQEPEEELLFFHHKEFYQDKTDIDLVTIKTPLFGFVRFSSVIEELRKRGYEKIFLSFCRCEIGGDKKKIKKTLPFKKDFKDLKVKIDKTIKNLEYNLFREKKENIKRPTSDHFLREKKGETRLIHSLPTEIPLAYQLKKLLKTTEKITTKEAFSTIEHMDEGMPSNTTCNQDAKFDERLKKIDESEKIKEQTLRERKIANQETQKKLDNRETKIEESKIVPQIKNKEDFTSKPTDTSKEKIATASNSSKPSLEELKKRLDKLRGSTNPTLKEFQKPLGKLNASNSIPMKKKSRGL